MDVREADAGQSGSNDQGAVIEDDGTADIDLNGIDAMTEGPGVGRAAWIAPTDAGVIQQVARMRRFHARREVGRRSNHCETQGRADGDRDHVLCQVLARPDAGIETLCHDIDHPVVGDDIQRDFG